MEKKGTGDDGKSEKRGASAIAPALLVISLSPVPYSFPLERERGLCGGERTRGENKDCHACGKLCKQCQARENKDCHACGKLCKQCQARENKDCHARGKLCKQCQARENGQPTPRAGKDSTSDTILCSFN